jgi:hypothetical protein
MRCSRFDLVAAPRLCHIQTPVCQVNELVNLIRFCGKQRDSLANGESRDGLSLAAFVL